MGCVAADGAVGDRQPAYIDDAAVGVAADRAIGDGQRASDIEDAAAAVVAYGDVGERYPGVRWECPLDKDAAARAVPVPDRHARDIHGAGEDLKDSVQPPAV